MKVLIESLTPAEQPAFRLMNPKAGDIMMWTGHVAIVYEVVEKKGTKYLVYANMGGSGPNLIGDGYWLKADDTAKIDSMGSGTFIGFWTPP